jgi:opacity protein-like surface antigen
MRTILIAAATIGAVGLLAACSDGASAEGFYVGTYGGVAEMDTISYPNVDDHTGFVIGGVLGTTLDQFPGVRVELDVSHRSSDVDVAYGPGINVTHSTFALMGNAVWDLPLDAGPVHPYVEAGAGYASTEATFENIAVAKVENSGFAWQLGAGINSEIADGVMVGVGYRYLQDPGLAVLGTTLSDGANHEVLVRLNFKFKG